MAKVEVILNTLKEKNIEQCLISVVIPCFNGEKWIGEAVQSVFNQTWENLEILVFDDGSTDRSSEILESLTLQDKRLKILGDSQNHGIVHALNSLINAASGEYIARMDADDICLPNRLVKQYYFLQDNHYDACGSWFTEIGLGPARVIRWPYTEEALKAAMLFQNTILHPSFIAHRKVYERFQYREAYQLAEDYDLFIRAICEFRIANIPESLLYYRRHNGQATQAKRCLMEIVTQSIRAEALHLNGIEVGEEELYIHNLIRAPKSIRDIQDFEKIESWLMKLMDCFEEQESKKVVASQWTRAAIRAAPLGWSMFQRYRSSPLYRFLNVSTDLNLFVLAIIRLPYESKVYNFLQRFGLSG